MHCKIIGTIFSLVLIAMLSVSLYHSTKDMLLKYRHWQNRTRSWVNCNAHEIFCKPGQNRTNLSV